jgi:hypothetical protein
VALHRHVAGSARQFRDRGHQPAEDRRHPAGNAGRAELERYERIQAERAGFGPQAPQRDPLEIHAGDREAPGILADILARDEAELSASQLRDLNLADEDHLANLYARWQGETQDALRSRYERELRATLPPEYHDEPLGGTAT